MQANGGDLTFRKHLTSCYCVLHLATLVGTCFYTTSGNLYNIAFPRLSRACISENRVQEYAL
uniref:Uncharacterized protein n=1 Tax=Anguilla anguilla TaxID=7936 RepID=A0A0E9W6W3_ANGAN